MRHATMVCGDFPDVRAGRITWAMRNEGWAHDAITRAYPPQFEDAYTRIDWNPFRTYFTDAIRKSEGELFHVHGELHHYFPVTDIKEVSDKPVILNVHDLTCSRTASVLDAFEAECIAAADGLVWVTEEQREFARAMDLDVDKPSCILPNYVSSRYFIDKPSLPHIGGIVYEGGIDARGQGANDRDFSRISDALNGELHVFPGGNQPDYGIVHDTELDYPMLIHQLSRFDWGLAGYDEARESWLHSDPTKAYDYLSAGIPIIAMNTPKLIPLVEEGMGVWADDAEALKNLPDPAPFRKRVIANRGRYTVERAIKPLVELYEEVLS